MVNFITGIRIVLSIAILLCPALSASFYALYIFSGITDMVAVIFLIKVINVISGFVVRKEFVAAHTLMNKVTGALLFILPLTLPAIELRCSAVVVCLVASFATVQEGHYIRTGKV